MILQRLLLLSRRRCLNNDESDNTDVLLLKGALKIYSPTGSTQEIGEYLISWAKDHGMAAEIDHGMAVINPKATDLLLLGHMDTVPGKLEVEVDTDTKIITGRGAADAKGPLCAALAAVAKHSELWDKICVVGVPDEEGASEAAKYIREHWPERPVIILEPSTWSGITLSYMGRLFIRCKTTCPPSHSGHQEPFAGEVLSALWQHIAQDYHARIRNIKGNETGAEMELDIRFRDASVEDILAMIPENIEVDLVEKTMPYTANKNTKLTRSFLRAIRELEGMPVFKKKTGTSDMNVLGEHWAEVPMIAYGPGDGKLGHTDHEQISSEVYLKGIGVLEKALIYITNK